LQGTDPFLQGTIVVRKLDDQTIGESAHCCLYNESNESHCKFLWGFAMPDDLSLIDVKLLRLFDLLYSTRSVTRSAQRLGQSQPTVSIWLARLRSLLKDPLFVRVPSGMQPTPRADALIGTCREALDLIRRLSASEAHFDAALAARTFRICMIDASHVTMLPRLFSKVASIAPNVRLEAILIDRSAAKQLESGDADLSIGFLPELEAGFYEQTLFTQDWVCLVGPNHPRIRNTLSLASYRREDHVTTAAGFAQERLDATLKGSGVSRRVRLQLPGFLGLAAIVTDTELVATLPHQIGAALARNAGLRIFPCPVKVPSYPVKQYWHARYHHDVANRWLRSLCTDLFQNIGKDP
jgi:DNA-binding transcriptional LysR family regulator